MRVTPLLACAMMLAVGVPPALAAPPVFGRWLTSDRVAIIRVAPCGAHVCGAIDRVFDPNAPSRDINNPDPALARKSMIGATVLSGYAPGGDGWQGGRVYDPRSGRSYRSTMRLLDGGHLKVTGCLFIICRSLVWTRVN